MNTNIHPIIQSLRRINYIVELPDPFPPRDEIIRIFEAAVANRRALQSKLDPKDENQLFEYCIHKAEISVLEHKIEELKKVPDENPQTIANQPNELLPPVAKLLPDGCQPLPEPGHPLPDTVQPLPNDCQPLPPNNEPPDAAPDSSSSSDATDSNDTPPAAADPSESILATVEDPHRDEVQLNDLSDGYTCDRDRLAAMSLALRGGSPDQHRFAKLAPEQLDLIYLLLKEHSARAVAKLLALPPPVGLDFKISKSSLTKFRNTYLAKRAERERNAMLQSLEEIIDAENGETAFQTAAERILKLRILRAGNGDEENLDAIVTTFAKFRKLTLAERKQAHTELTNRLKSAKGETEVGTTDH